MTPDLCLILVVCPTAADTNFSSMTAALPAPAPFVPTLESQFVFLRNYYMITKIYAQSIANRSVTRIYIRFSPPQHGHQ